MLPQHGMGGEMCVLLHLHVKRKNGWKVSFTTLINSRVLFPLLPSEKILEAVFHLNSISGAIVMCPEPTSQLD